MRLAVKDWFHENKMNELKKDVQNTEVYAILKETEKAYNVFVGDTSNFMAYWVPKSCVIELEETETKSTLTDISFNEALEDWKHEMRFYR